MPAEPTTQPTAQEAAARLADRPVRLADDRDRRIHAVTTVVLGAVIGVVMATQNVLATQVGAVLRGAVYFAVVGGAIAWSERAARAVPRHARLASRIGLIASLVVGLVAVLPWLNLSAQTSPNSAAMVVVGAAAITVPTAIAALWIARARR